MTCKVKGSSINIFEKVAVTDLSALIVTVHVPPPVHVPLQALKEEPLLGLAVRVTEVPLLKVSEQSVPQLIPVAVTVPSADPALVTVRVKVEEKVAVTEVLALMVPVQVPVPEQPPPLQPAKTEPLAGVAVSVTTVPLV